jgi:hypothetical protein
MAKKNLFEKAKASTAAKPSKSEKSEVIVNDATAYQSIARLQEIKTQIEGLEAEQKMVYGEVRQLGVDSFVEKYQNEKRFTESFNIIAKDGNKTAQFLFAPTDNYIKIEQDRADYLSGKYGESVVADQTKFIFDNDMLEKYGEIISKLIENCKHIAEADKEKLFKAETKIAVAKGVIKEFRSNDKMREIGVDELVSDFLPIFQIKTPKVID